MSKRVAESIGRRLAGRSSRRSFLMRTAVVGAALATDPVNYLLRPATAYATVCGDGASCGSGWTAFCVTINNGVNQCPPGSFTAGWWKADGASVCGGAARYYVDCNASCIGGQPGHYSCGCRCAPGSTCDQRRTCCNQFRYGQCHQEIGCYGPVVCRVVSCVPPWRWADCSTAAATDNRTLSHSAPALPHAWDAIEQRYTQMVGPASVLGASVGGRAYPAGGIQQSYQHGLLAWSPATPAAMLTGLVAAYRQRGGPAGRLGFPTGDERATKDGKAALAGFRHGVLTAAGSISAAVLNGPLRASWTALTDNSAILGHPTADATATSDGGQVGLFQRGVLLWSPGTGTHFVSGAAAERYTQLGREGSFLGYPIRDTATSGSATVSAFEHGAIYASGTAAYVVSGEILSAYQLNGAQSGALGLPTSDERRGTGSTSTQSFEHGSITYDPTTGRVLVKVAT